MVCDIFSSGSEFIRLITKKGGIPNKMSSLFQLEVDIEGFTELKRSLIGIDIACNDLSPAWDEIEKDFREEQKGIFNKQGAHGSRSKWIELADSTKYSKRLKIRRGIYTLRAMKILQATGRLMDSLVGETSDSVLEKSPMQMTIGTRVPYGVYHQSRKPRKKLPRRAFLDFDSNQRKRWMRVLKAVLTGNINLQLAQQKPTKRVRI